MTEEILDSKPQCFECGKLIEHKSIKVYDAHFHPSCWKCMKCHSELGEVYFPITGESGIVCLVEKNVSFEILSVSFIILFEYLN